MAIEVRGLTASLGAVVIPLDPLIRFVAVSPLIQPDTDFLNTPAEKGLA